MTEYSAVAPPQQNFNQSTAFAAALQRAKQIAAKINPAGGNNSDNRSKRPLEDSSEPDAKKLACPDSPVGGGRSNPQPAMVMNMGGPINEDIKVPDKMVGLIIGRGGEQITRLQAESGCKIQMAPDSAGTQERICSLSGSREAIARAKEMISSIVQQRGRTEGLPPGTDGPSDSPNPFGPPGVTTGGGGGGPPAGGGHNFTGMNNMGATGGVGGGPAGRNFIEIMIPGPKVGLIIGKGGETIKQLQERSGAKMVVIQEGPNPEQEKPLRITGEPQKVEYAKQLVYDLIAEKEIQAYNRGGGGARNRNQDFNNEGGYGGAAGGGPGGDVEVLVPRAAVGVVIGKGGDMIKKIQAETGARVQFQQLRDDVPGERICYISGKPQNVEQARMRIEELIDSVVRRDGNGGEGGRNGGVGGRPRGGERFDRNAGGRNGEYGGGGAWDDGRGAMGAGMGGGAMITECSFSVPASKCGVIIGRGGEQIKQINQQSGAHCELDRRAPANPNGDKIFTIRGEPDQLETAKRLISDKIQIPITFMPAGGGAPPSNLPTAYPGMAGGGYNAQGWGMPGPGGPAGGAGGGYPQQQGWGQPQGEPPMGGPHMGGAPGVPGAPGGQAAPGQPDYSLQWAEYYRSLGMHREAEMIEQQAKAKNPAAPPAAGTSAGQPGPTTAPGPAPTGGASAPPAGGSVTAGAPSGAAAANGSQPDYSAQWAEYYRSMGKIKEAEAIEAQMKNKGASGPATGATAAGPVPGLATATQSATPGAYQQPYGAYQAQGGYYGAGQPAAPQAGQYGGYAGYNYGSAAAPPQQVDNN